MPVNGYTFDKSALRLVHGKDPINLPPRARRDPIQYPPSKIKEDEDAQRKTILQIGADMVSAAHLFVEHRQGRHVREERAGRLG